MLDKLKQQTWFQPLMPGLRLLRREVDTLRYLPQSWPEEQVSRNKLKQNHSQAQTIESALKAVRNEGGYFSGWALSRSALRNFSSKVFVNGHPPRLVEFGSGQSTLYWSWLSKKLDFSLTSFEHDPYWYNQLQQKLPSNSHFKYVFGALQQLSKQERQTLWEHPEQAHQLYLSMGTPVPDEEAGNVRLQDCFYQFDATTLFKPNSIDGIVLDGPNGNGRSIAFALLHPFLKPDAWILVDDYDHYPFLQDLRRLRPFLNQEIHVGAGKRWCLLQLQG